MTERQQQILSAIVREYIRTACPVGSKVLSEKHDFGIGPAMIRQEMASLEKEGLISQPHTSAGRVPTDKAYRLYISSLEKERVQLSGSDREKVNREILRQKSWDELVKELSRVVSEISGELSVSGVEGGATYAYGFSSLAHEPEMADPRSVDDLFAFIDGMERSFDRMWRLMFSESFGVFIGRENPVKEIRSFSVITGRYNLPKQNVGFVSIIGPKRMDYRRNVALVRYVTERVANR